VSFRSYLSNREMELLTDEIHFGCPGVYNYTADAYGEFSSSAIAGQGFLRNMFGELEDSFPVRTAES